MNVKFRARHLFWVFISVFFAVFLSYSPTDLSGVPSDASSVPIIVLFSLLITFLLDSAIKKDRALHKAINLELSRLRRVHHIAEQLNNKNFKTKIDSVLENYLGFFVRNSFSMYTNTGSHFRAITHTVYGFLPKSKKEEILYKEMLTTTRELAATRQQISALIQERISKFGWVVLILVMLFVVLAVLITRGVAQFSNVVSTVTLTAIFMVTLFLREVDFLYSDELNEFSDRYAKNLSDIDGEQISLKKMKEKGRK